MKNDKFIQAIIAGLFGGMYNSSAKNGQNSFANGCLAGIIMYAGGIIVAFVLVIILIKCTGG